MFRLATRLSERHAAITGTRSLDILHVAAAKTLRAVEFASFDTVPLRLECFWTALSRWLPMWQ
jgi:hypothetical protein